MSETPAAHGPLSDERWAEIRNIAGIDSDPHTYQQVVTLALRDVLAELASVKGVRTWLREEAFRLLAERNAAESRAEKTEAELARVKPLLNAYVEAESADAAAGSHAGRAEEAEAEVERLRAANKTNADEYDAALLAIHEARDHWQERAVAESERAEQAEAALAGMRERLGTASGLPSLHRDDEIVLRHLDGTEHRLRITEAKAVEPGSMEVSAEPATPRTALERAADEQGNGEGGGA